MSRLFFLCLFFVLAFVPLSVFAKSAGVRYPFVESVKGKVLLLEDTLKIENRKSVSGEKERALRAGLGLKDKAQILVLEGSEVRIAMSKDNMLTLFSDSRLLIPTIGWEKGEVSEVHLLQGSLRWTCHNACEMMLSTPLSTNSFAAGDYVLEYIPTTPKVTLSVLAGLSSFSGRDNERSVQLKGGEKAGFIGLLENKEPAFDQLLQGRKVAKGSLTAVEGIDPDQLKKWAVVSVKKAAPVKAKAQAPKNPRHICASPFGELQQCAWICERENAKKSKVKKRDCDLDSGAKCVRMRCDANGLWSDRAELSNVDNKCGAEPIVDLCDY